MKAYLDANVYVSYLLGQSGERKALEAFRKSIGCAFSIVGSDTVFAEVQIACGRRSIILLQRLVDDLKGAGKLQIVKRDESTTGQAISNDEKTGGKFGRNDFIHALLAQKYADVFVTGDLKFKPVASGFVKTRTLSELLSEL